MDFVHTTFLLHVVFIHGDVRGYKASQIYGEAISMWRKWADSKHKQQGTLTKNAGEGDSTFYQQ